MRAVMSAINSDLQNLVRCAEATYSHLPVGDADEGCGMVDLPAPENLITLLQRRDLNRELFRRLRMAATPTQIDIVGAWEKAAFADHEPSLGHFDRRRVHEVRLLARRILQELATELSPQARGIEMIM
jgi:hypothetical protein